MEDEEAVTRELTALGLDPSAGDNDDDIDAVGGGDVEAPPDVTSMEDEEDEEETEGWLSLSCPSSSPALFLFK